MNIYLEDVDVTLRLKDEAPEPQCKTDLPGPRARLFKTWGQWAQHYGVTWTPEPSDYVTANRLLKHYPEKELDEATKEFWLVASGPLIKGEYPHHFILFASYLKGGNS